MWLDGVRKSIADAILAFLHIFVLSLVLLFTRLVNLSFNGLDLALFVGELCF